ncbi:MAG: hypothetical protein ACK4WH_02860 [Phycisphaerales bacterium]
MNSTPPPPAKAPSTCGPASLWLRRLRRTARNLLVLQRLGWIIACVLGAALLAGVADFILRTPSPVRIVLWLAGLALVGLWLIRSVWPAVRFNPPLTEVALRVENSPEGRAAGLSGVLASGLELSSSTADPVAQRLAEPVIREATRRIGGLTAARLVAPSRTLRSLGWLALSIVAVAATTLAEPAMSLIGAQRILWPFGAAQWPRRTGVADVTGVRIHPLGSALALRAAVTRSSGDVEDTRVAAVYRTTADGRTSPDRRVLLTSQGRPVKLPEGAVSASATGTGHLFERLLEPSGLTADTAAASAPAGGKGGGREITFEYWFETDDDRSETARILLVDPPMIRSASARVDLPPYAAAFVDRFSDLTRSSGTIDLGPGTDDRASPAPILAGSTVTLTLQLNKPVPGLPQLVPDARVWLARCLGPDALSLWLGDETRADAPRAEVRTDGSLWTIRWTLADPVRFSVKPTDEHGIASVEEASYRFDALKDNPPTAVVTVPSEDKSVLATATVELAGEGRDDVGLDWVGLERRLARRPQGSEGGGHEPAGDPSELVRRSPPAPADGAGADSRRLSVRHTLDLSTLDLKPGDELWITALAADAYELNGVRHEPARSGVRKLRIMSREELVQQVWAELGAIRRTAIRLDQDQKEIRASSARPGAEEARKSQRSQAGLTERMARQADALERTAERIRENNLADQALQDVLRQARAALEQAGEQSAQAAQSLGEAASAESESRPESARQSRREADQAQQQVREELARLIDALDQGEDSYASRRTLEQLVQEQQALQDRTQRAGEQTTGKSAEQLSPQERDELAQIAQEQEQLAQKLRDAVSKMQDRERKMQKQDPAAAQAMANAAQRAQREQTEQKMQQAARSAQQNQTNNAQQNQQQALQSMQQMLQDLDRANENRDEVLRRFLASLIDSIRGLITQQQAQLDALDAGIESGSLRGLDAGMARLHQNTLGVLDQAADGPRDAAGIADHVERAADAQAAAVVALRDEPVNHDEVRAQEQLSLDRLNKALEEAQKIDEQAEERQQERKREELKKRYIEALEKQVSIKDETAGLVGVEPTRRTRNAARELAGEQSALRDTLAAIRSDNADITAAKVFDYAHTRLDELCGNAAAALAEGDATPDVLRRQTSSARLLQSLIAALDRAKDDKPFREREQAGGGGGGGGGQQPLVPPAAEIKLLRLMQQEIVDLTRAAAEAPAPPPDAVDEVVSLQRELAQRGQELLERLMRQQQPDAPAPDPQPAPPAPTPDPQPQP